VLSPSPEKAVPALALFTAAAAVIVGALAAPSLGPGVWALALIPLLVAAWTWRVRLDRAEQALRHSEARKAAVLRASPDAIVAIDDRGRVIEFNPAAEAVFGYSRAAAVGRPMADLIIPARLRDTYRAGLGRSLTTGVPTVVGKRLELTA
jgi:PAS domain-containing protein